jgi:hypothetical protein
MKIGFSVRDLNRSTLERMVEQLLVAKDGDEKKILDKLQKRAETNDLADLDEEMHGKPNTPEVTEDDMPGDGELADVPKKKAKKNG